MAISGAISGGSVQPLADSTGAIARQGFPAGGNTMYFGGDSFYYHPPEGTPGYDGKGWEFKDDELLSKVKEKEKPKSPPPTVPDPHPPELIHDKNDAIAVSTSPDVCRAPVNPVPFPVYGVGGDDTNYTSTVRSNGLIIKKWDSKFSKTNGDGPGTGLGLMSGTVGDVVEPTSHSPIVRVQGQPIIRHRDTCTLNKGNCPGEYIHAKSTDVHKAPDGKDEQDKKKSGWQSFKDQLYDKSGTVQTADGVIGKAGEYWNDPSKIKGDASSAWNAIPSWQSVKDFGSNVGSGLYNAGEQVVNDPLGTGGKVYDWGSGKVSDGWQGTKDAWNTDGAAGVLGAGVGAGIDLINPAKKAKMLGNIAEGAGELGEAAAKKALKDKAEKEAREKAAREAAERKASEDGKPGARSTRLRNVPCFDLPKGVNRDEFRRQLKEQQAAINKMSADEMAYAHTALDQAREAWTKGGKKGSFTNLLRDSKAQTAARDDFRKSLEGLNYTETQINQAMSSVNATHFLDIIAGGNPSDLGIGGAAENQRIGPMWTQKGRAESLREEANLLRKDGKSGHKMNVELKICGE
jgi:hypothetical protein